SPWGGGSRGGEGQAGDDGGETDVADDGGDGSAPGSTSPPPRGPRNPWLPPGDAPPRRSATIEDIFRGKDRRSRGPGGSGGGGMPRLPQRPDGKSWMPVVIGGMVLLWIAVTS